MGEWYMLYCGDTPAARVEMTLMQRGILARSIEVLNEDILPMSMRRKIETGRVSGIDAFRHWLTLRAVPEYRENLNDVLTGLFDLPKQLYGRALGLQYTAAALSYFQSGFDRYLVIPEHTGFVYYGFEDWRWQDLYVLSSKKPRQVRQESESGAYGVEAFLLKKRDDLPTRSYTIRSSVPTWWGRDDDRHVLSQQCTSWTAEGTLRRREAILQHADALGFAGKRSLDGDILRTDLSGIISDTGSFEVTWLSEYTDLVSCAGHAGGLLRQIPEILAGLNGAAEAAGAMERMVEKIEAAGSSVAPEELGLAVRGNGEAVLPVIIL